MNAQTYQQGDDYVCYLCPFTTKLASEIIVHLEQHAMEGKCPTK